MKVYLRNKRQIKHSFVLDIKQHPFLYNLAVEEIANTLLKVNENGSTSFNGHTFTRSEYCH